MRQKCLLALSNGQTFEGDLIGAPIYASGEMVFTTGMVGYSEALTDPSYYGQILTFTYPLIGNYGIPSRAQALVSDLPLGFESSRTQVAAVVMSLDSAEVFHWESFQCLDSWLRSENIPGIVGLDTRHLVQLIRSGVKLLGKVVPEKAHGQRYGDHEGGGEMNKEGFYDPDGHNVINKVSVKKPELFGQGDVTIGIVDCGIKWNIIRRIIEQGCRVLLLPWSDDLVARDGTASKTPRVDGWLISNGPGNPKNTGKLVEAISQLLKGDKPVLGICLGHQLISLAAGAQTKRMAFGHRSHNQPVYQVGTKKGFMTTQNHGYVVEDGSLSPDWEVWFRNGNDQTIEGIRHKTRPMRSVQFHPEASGGPRDTAWILEQFVTEVKRLCR